MIGLQPQASGVRSYANWTTSTAQWFQDINQAKRLKYIHTGLIKHRDRGKYDQKVKQNWQHSSYPSMKLALM